ncbi:hypothetical protein H0H93_010323 [Arthromyces matolae]|nr:hypothetical protein H0H93_010323 [Arthromyces matolae]
MSSPEPSVSDDTTNSPVTEEISGEVAHIVVKDDQYYMQFATLLALLKLIYPLHPSEQPVLSKSEWISVLKLSSLWTMIDLRELAIKSLERLGLIRKVVLARTYGIITWLKESYIDLASRYETPSMDDAQRLGLETTVKLFNIREMRWVGQAMENEPSVTMSETVVDEEFIGELQGIQSARDSDIIDRILWAKSRGHPQSLRLAYIDLVTRETPISVEEALKLGHDTTIHVLRSRERLLRIKGWSRDIDVRCLSSGMWYDFEEEFGTVASVSALYAPKQVTMTTDRTPMSPKDHEDEERGSKGGTVRSRKPKKKKRA